HGGPSGGRAVTAPCRSYPVRGRASSPLAPRGVGGRGAFLLPPPLRGGAGEGGAADPGPPSPTLPRQGGGDQERPPPRGGPYWPLSSRVRRSPSPPSRVRRPLAAGPATWSRVRLVFRSPSLSGGSGSVLSSSGTSRSSFMAEPPSGTPSPCATRV